ncbi:hypothetical protein SAMN05421773_110214 [Streptomyces aidingensis]|uniref:Uncharacterized protein n=1 Tax=Streptomyces aidingensis TaxID=910347 RepID=A0A1I1Q196_9ACTN|nr:hypothetical protein SAMN05421773_110214 [Streptomyces aidingensis]
MTGPPPPGIRDALAAYSDAKVAAAVSPHRGLSEIRLRGMVEGTACRSRRGQPPTPLCRCP